MSLLVTMRLIPSFTQSLGQVTWVAHRPTLTKGKTVLLALKSVWATMWKNSSPIITLAPYDRPQWQQQLKCMSHAALASNQARAFNSCCHLFLAVKQTM